MADKILAQMHTIDPKSRLQEFTQAQGWVFHGILQRRSMDLNMPSI